MEDSHFLSPDSEAPTQNFPHSLNISENNSSEPVLENAVNTLVTEALSETPFSVESQAPSDLPRSDPASPSVSVFEPVNSKESLRDSTKYITPLEAFISISEQNTQKLVEPIPEQNNCCSNSAAVEDLRVEESDFPQPGGVSSPTLLSDETDPSGIQEDVATYFPHSVPDWLHQAPHAIAFAEKEYHLKSPQESLDNYLRGCLWSPDGSCILTNSRDNVLRLFNLPNVLLSQEPPTSDVAAEEMHSVLAMRENELVYDYAWYPSMNSADPSTCCFASTARRNPIRLWDAFTGGVRAMYRPFNHMGEAISAYSIAFSADGQRLYAGFNRFMHIFDVSRPGRDSVRRPKLGQKPLQGGIVSCIAVPRTPERQLYATGSYNGTVAMFAEPGKMIGRVSASRTGVTQVLLGNRFAKESGAPWYLAAGCRMDSRIFLWDARNLSEPLLVLHRRVENHQRFQFDIDPSGQYLFTGSQTGVVCIYDLVECLKHSESGELSKPALIWRAHSDCAHGLSIHPFLPVIATTAGQRRIRPPWHKSVGGKKRKIASSSSGADSSSEECTDTDVDETNLTDDEASLLIDEPGSITPSNSLPLCGRLTRLPCENRLSLWSFPMKEV